MYRIMLAQSKHKNFESLYQYLTTNVDGVISPLELNSKEELDKRVEKMSMGMGMLRMILSSYRLLTILSTLLLILTIKRRKMMLLALVVPKVLKRPNNKRGGLNFLRFSSPSFSASFLLK